MRHWLCVAALCAIPASAAADAPLPPTANAAPVQPPASGAARLALAATPTQETRTVTAPLPRGNPGDPLDRVAREEAADSVRAVRDESARASDLEAKEQTAAPARGGSRDTEGK